MMRFLEKIHAALIKWMSYLFLHYKQDINPDIHRKGLIFCQMGIGNCILFLPVIRELHQSGKKFEIMVLSGNRTNGDLLQSQLPDMHLRFANIYKMGVLKKFHLFRELKREKFDFAIINFLGLRMASIYLTLYCRIPYRIGHITRPAGALGKFDFFFNYGYSIKGLHEIEFNSKLLHPLLGDGIPQKGNHLGIDQNAYPRAVKFIESLPNKHKIIMQIHSSMGVQKNWYGSYYIKLASLIKEHYDAAIILAGSPQERTQIDRIFKDFGYSYHNIAGDFQLLEVAAIIKSCDIFIGNDSGLGHISAALGQNTVTIIGMTDPNRIRPIGERTHLFYKELPCSPCDAIGKYPLYKNCPYNYRCMQSITPEEVFSLVDQKQMLRSYSRRS